MADALSARLGTPPSGRLSSIPASVFAKSISRREPGGGPLPVGSAGLANAVGGAE